jgi:hypothetical protein
MVGIWIFPVLILIYAFVLVSTGIKDRSPVLVICGLWLCLVLAWFTAFPVVF